MIVIYKKRLQVMVACFLISVCVFSFKISENKNMEKTQENTNDVVQVNSTIISSKKIVVDAGHGTPDEGAESKNGTTEAQINLKIALKLKKMLEDAGSTVILTRTDENSICSEDSKTLREKKISDIKNRVKIGNESGADIFVSIHLNKIPQSQYWGWQCFYKDKDEQSIELAKQIQTNLNETIQKDNKRVAMKLTTVYLMKYVKIPISIVECGFLSNPDEEKLLIEDEYQNKLALGIYNGIIDYFSE